MTQEIHNVIVLGATGNLGPHVLSALLAAGFSVKVLSRNQLSSSAVIPSGIEVLQSDYSFKSLVDAFKGQDAVISTVSTLTVPQQLNIIDAAAAAKVKRFLPSEFGSDTSVDDDGAIEEFLKGKQEVVRYLRTKEIDGLSWSALCPGAWVDWMLEEGNGLLGLDLASKAATIIDDGDQDFTASTIDLVAKATAAILLHPEETRNRYVQVHSFTLTQNSLLEALERVSGAKFSTTRTSRGELHALAKKHLARSVDDSGHYELVTATVLSGSKLVLFPERAAHWNKVLGLAQEEDLDEMVRRVWSKMERA
ncbi:hypothetical protein F5Y14DRAFT_430135 [Nemania sp. NC0429]|nr:hypothetical protein F5Y14DRAFT_430135 [Nemania sp. NC0429]